MIEGSKQINILVTVTFLCGFISVGYYILFPFLALITYLSPAILENMALFNSNQY